MARGDLQCRLDEAALEIVRWLLRIATSGEHIKLRLGYRAAGDGSKFATGRIRGGGPAAQVVNNP
jgi:hypothetical protein